MSITDGQQALIDRIVRMDTEANIVLPNGKGAPLPRYVVQVAGGAQRTATLKGITDASPEIVVRVETKRDSLAMDNDALVKALVSRFAVNDKFGCVRIQSAPSVRPPLTSVKGAYSVPVVITGRQFF